jgi:hypothetical protein
MTPVGGIGPLVWRQNTRYHSWHPVVCRTLLDFRLCRVPGTHHPSGSRALKRRDAVARGVYDHVGLAGAPCRRRRLSVSLFSRLGQEKTVLCLALQCRSLNDPAFAEITRKRNPEDFYEYRSSRARRQNEQPSLADRMPGLAHAFGSQ